MAGRGPALLLHFGLGGGFFDFVELFADRVGFLAVGTFFEIRAETFGGGLKIVLLGEGDAENIVRAGILLLGVEFYGFARAALGEVEFH